MRAGPATVRRAWQRGPGKRSGGRRRTLGAGCAAAGLAILLAACGPAIGGTTGGSGSSPSGSNGGTTATYAMAPGGLAQYPFPFIDDSVSQFDSVYNLNDFQELMYRPLYWFGTGLNPYLNTQLSLADPPVYQGHLVKITLKRNYKWSNGEPVDAADVVFWLNMMANQGANGVDWTPHGLPGDVDNVHAASKYVVEMDITTPQFSETWFTNNELSEITPMPMAWDVTRSGAKAGSGGCHAAGQAARCAAVYDYLNAQAQKNPSTYPASPIWSVVDGPWKLGSLSSLGRLVLNFNPKYGGKVPAGHITTFIELPFTTESAEFDVLQDPSGSNTIDVGYLPTVDAEEPPAGGIVGANASTLSDYKLTAVYPWQLSYFPYNFNNSKVGPIFDQLYFREAFQDLVDQEGVINGPLHGYGKPTIGPVTSYPVTKYLSPALARKGDPWTLNIGGAKKLLSEHGWQVTPGGTDTCIHPGTGLTQCGPHIAAGEKLQFTLQYAAGIDWMESAVREMASNASLAGISLTLDQLPFNTVTQNAFTLSKPNTWELAEWGSWTYDPDYLPTGDELFEGGAPNNTGAYNIPRNNQLIEDTLTSRTPAEFQKAMYKWEDYLAQQLPVVYQPDTPQLIETINGLDIGPQNSALSITPEDWVYRK
jgi:peptide/nickel transport system substrate-binding protein